MANPEIRTVNGRHYLVSGRLRGITGDPGTLLGPNARNQFFVVLGRDEETGETMVGRAQAPDMIPHKDADSVTEFNVRRQMGG